MLTNQFISPCQPALVVLWKRTVENSQINKKQTNKKSDLVFIQCLVLTAFSSFLFGWHVHEKAIMMILVPMIPLAFYGKTSAKHFFILNTIGSYSIFPLLKDPAETPIKVLLLLIYTLYAFEALSTFHSNLKLSSFKLLNFLEASYLFGLLFIQFYTSFADTLFAPLHDRLPFLYLLWTSVYCAFGVLITWLRLNNQLLFHF